MSILRFHGDEQVLVAGPATQSIEMLEKMMNAGMSVVRMNFSHGTYEVSCQLYRLSASIGLA